MNQFCWLCFVLTLSLSASAAEAAVIVNEVAWMGTATSANDEWIELYNDGSTETVDGWVLSDGMNFNVPLTGTIAANSYAVLERTDDATVAGSAFLIYTGSLVNTGATLTLKRGDGSVADQVAGGTDWSAIGGDNVTKETAQYTSGGWVTAIPTPGAANSTVSEAPQDTEDEDDESTSAATRSGGGGGVAKSRPAEPVILHAEPSQPTVRISMPATLYVNQEVSASAIVSAVGKTIAQSMEYQWNFGDLSTGSGAAAVHRYAYPGEYVVSVRAAYKDFVATDKVAVTVLPRMLSMTQNAAGDLQIHNNAQYEINASAYTVTGMQTVTFPAGTYIAPRATVTIPWRQLGAAGVVLVLKDGAGQAVAYYNPNSVRTETTSTLLSVPSAASPMRAHPTVSELMPTANFSFGAPPNNAAATSGTTSTTDTATLTGSALPVLTAPLLATAEAGTPVPARPLYPYVGLAAVIGVALLAAVAGRTGAPSPVPATFQTESGSTTDHFPFR